jgi:3-isopropylmalate/(R)-2-methylmalate dehydratase large subunit
MTAAGTRPGLRVAATDPHITQMGAWGMVGVATTPVLLYEAWSRGSLPVGLPRTVRVHVNGPVPAYLGPTDLVLDLIHQVGYDGYAGAVLEFEGDAVDGMPPAQRAELLGAASLTGCLTALAPLTEAGLEAARRAGLKDLPSLGDLDRFRPDAEATYVELAIINADTVAPRLGDMRRGRVEGAAERAGQLLERVVVGGCVGGDLASLDHLADLVEDHRVSADVGFWAVASSAATHRAAEENGLADRLKEQGAILVTPAELPSSRGVGLTLTTNGCLADDGFVASLPTIVASAAAGRLTTFPGYA